jgi:hypothetical protein
VVESSRSGVSVVGAVQGGCEWRREGWPANLGVAFVFVKREKKKPIVQTVKNSRFLSQVSSSLSLSLSLSFNKFQLGFSLSI